MERKTVAWVGTEWSEPSVMTCSKVEPRLVWIVFHPTVSPTAPELEAQMTLKLVSPVSLAVLA